MTLIALLACLALEMFWQRADEYRRLDWFSQYTNWLLGRQGKASWWDGVAGVVAVLLVPMLVVGTIQSVLACVWLGLLELIFGIVVLVYCLHFQSLDRLVDEYCDARDVEDEARAQSVAAELIGEPSISDGDVVKAVLTQSNERLFSVLLWFVLLGPLGALLCRLSYWLGYERADSVEGSQEGQEPDFTDAARRLSGILSWAPARLLAVGYAVTGSFEDAVHAWRESPQRTDEDFTEANSQILHQTGLGALRASSLLADQPQTQTERGDEESSGCTLIQAAHGLVLRAIVAWAIVVALVTLAGWVA